MSSNSSTEDYAIDPWAAGLRDPDGLRRAASDVSTATGSDAGSAVNSSPSLASTAPTDTSPSDAETRSRLSKLRDRLPRGLGGRKRTDTDSESSATPSPARNVLRRRRGSSAAPESAVSADTDSAYSYESDSATSSIASTPYTTPPSSPGWSPPTIVHTAADSDDGYLSAHPQQTTTSVSVSPSGVRTTTVVIGEDWTRELDKRHELTVGDVTISYICTMQDNGRPKYTVRADTTGQSSAAPSTNYSYAPSPSTASSVPTQTSYAPPIHPQPTPSAQTYTAPPSSKPPTQTTTRASTSTPTRASSASQSPITSTNTSRDTAPPSKPRKRFNYNAWAKQDYGKTDDDTAYNRYETRLGGMETARRELPKLFNLTDASGRTDLDKLQSLSRETVDLVMDWTDRFDHDSDEGALIDYKSGVYDKLTDSAGTAPITDSRGQFEDVFDTVLDSIRTAEPGSWGTELESTGTGPRTIGEWLTQRASQLNPADEEQNARGWKHATDIYTDLFRTAQRYDDLGPYSAAMATDVVDLSPDLTDQEWQSRHDEYLSIYEELARDQSRR